MNDIKERFLPIGTVVILKGATKRLMISGFCAIDGNDDKKIWDYSGCMYPEGFLSSNQICLFDHNQIEKIYHIGLANDSEEKAFKENLNIFITEFEKQRDIKMKQTVEEEKTTKRNKSSKKADTKKTTNRKKSEKTVNKKTKTTSKKKKM